MGSYRPISKVAIVGAGASGLVAAKYLIAEKVFDRIDIFEQQPKVGGIWNLTKSTQSSHIPIPQTDPRYDRGGQTNNLVNGEVRAGSDAEIETPLYDDLETNIPFNLMEFSDKSFPAGIPLFPRHETVLEYLEEYADDVKHLIHFRTKVVNVRQVDESQVSQGRWHVTTRCMDSGRTTSAIYDAMVVANSHYAVPHVPEIKGIGEWNAAYPGTIIHSKAYRNSKAFTCKKVLVIGNSASGVDIGVQISHVCKQPLLQSGRSTTLFALGPSASKEDVPEVAEFIAPSSDHVRAVRFFNGRVEDHLDAVVFATGYLYSFPFLEGLKPPLITDGSRTRGLYQHLFNIEHRSLAFPVLNLKVIPFPLAENQAAVIARVWSGRLALPPEIEMRSWEKKTIDEQGDGRYFHVLGPRKDGEMINWLYEYAAQAERQPGLENEGLGKMGNLWTEKEMWMRSMFPAIKRAYVSLGEARTQVRKIEELGINYEEWKKSQEANGTKEHVP